MRTRLEVFFSFQKMFHWPRNLASRQASCKYMKGDNLSFFSLSFYTVVAKEDGLHNWEEFMAYFSPRAWKSSKFCKALVSVSRLGQTSIQNYCK